tara:strand:- start:415 stop:648 length:234 start_codon:yes stop_codon:yes gene_type:complete
MSDDRKIRYGSGGVMYYEQPEDPIEKEQKELEASLKQSKAAKAERVDNMKKKKKKEVIQEIMGDDLKEEKETLDEII